MKSYVSEPMANLKPVIYEIIKKCDQYGIRFDRNLITFVVNLLSLDPKYKIFGNDSFDRNYYAEIVFDCLEILANDHTPMLLTLKMQIFFMESFSNKDEIIEKHIRNAQNKTAYLLKEIIDADVITKDEMDEVFNNVIKDIILTMSLGSAENKEVIKMREITI